MSSWARKTLTRANSCSRTPGALLGDTCPTRSQERHRMLPFQGRCVKGHV